MEYRSGELYRHTLFDSKGEKILCRHLDREDPPRPRSVPPDANYYPGLTQWVHASPFHAGVRRHGLWQWWIESGDKLREEEYSEGTLRLHRKFVVDDYVRSVGALESESRFNEHGELIFKRSFRHSGEEFRIERRFDGATLSSETLPALAAASQLIPRLSEVPESEVFGLLEALVPLCFGEGEPPFAPAFLDLLEWVSAYPALDQHPGFMQLTQWEGLPRQRSEYASLIKKLKRSRDPEARLAKHFRSTRPREDEWER
jgi:hypothetical protein